MGTLSGFLMAPGSQGPFLLKVVSRPVDTSEGWYVSHFINSFWDGSVSWNMEFLKSNPPSMDVEVIKGIPSS